VQEEVPDFLTPVRRLKKLMIEAQRELQIAKQTTSLMQYLMLDLLDLA
jgi:hypothetical protein